jgi:DNA primase
VEELNRIILTERARTRGEIRTGDHIKTQTTPKYPEVTAAEIASESLRIQERESIRLLISYGINKIEEEYQLYEFMLKELSDVEFQTPVYNEILRIFKEHLALGHVIDAEYLIAHGPEPIQKEVIDLVTTRFDISDNWAKRNIHVPVEKDLLGKSVLDNIIRLKHRVVLKLIEDTRKEIRNSKDDLQTDQLLNVARELNKIKTELAKSLGITII